MAHIYIYHWYQSEKNDDDTQIIRAYGLNEKSENVCLSIEGFTPYFYVELPSRAAANTTTNLLSRYTLSTQLVMKYQLYKYDMGRRPFLFCQFKSQVQLEQAACLLKQHVYLPSSGRSALLKVHENKADAVLQLTALRQIPTAGWLKYEGKLVPNTQRLTSCHEEYRVNWKSLFPCVDTKPTVLPTVLSFDLEVNSECTSSMPCDKPGDRIFQISCVITDPMKGTRNSTLLTLGSNVVVEGVEVLHFKTEKLLLQGFMNVILKTKPNAMVGYNIMGFDIPYLLKRCKRYFLMADLRLVGFNIMEEAADKKIKWSSNAYGNQEYDYIDWEGILIVDLYRIVKRDFNLDNYKLETIANHLLKEGKDPVTCKDIFEAYRTMDAEKLSTIGKYCVKDSDLVMRLMDHLHCWVTLSEMAKVFRVDMMTVYTKGEQIKIYSQVYTYCLLRDIVVDTNGYEASVNEQFTGAHVFDPVPGYYTNVVPLDFASLYPSIMIAYNICYSTLVTDASVPDIKCNIFTWEDHVGCAHDPTMIKYRKLSKQIADIKLRMTDLRTKRDAINRHSVYGKIKVKDVRKEYQDKINQLNLTTKPFIVERQKITVPTRVLCTKRQYRFYKAIVQKGVIPTIIQQLLNSRKETKAELKTTMDTQARVVLDKKQLAYKVSANSMYGSMGVPYGLLPFMPGAMCVTHVGRESIKKVAGMIKNDFKGELVYGDTDSNYVRFPHIQTSTKLWDHAIDVADRISQVFPAPMRLTFENTIYEKFMILNKKRYMYQECNREGILDPTIGKKGVVLARRDNSGYLKRLYEQVIIRLFDKVSVPDIETYLMNNIRQLFERVIPDTEFVITKSIKDAEGDWNEEESTLGDYKTTKQLPNDPEERECVLNGMTERQYALQSCPAPVQLAERMKDRGTPVAAGSRIEYVVLENSESSKQADKIEEYDYYLKQRRYLSIDKFYYLKSLINPLNQVLSLESHQTSFVQQQYIYHQKHCDMVRQLNGLFRPSFKEI